MHLESLYLGKPPRAALTSAQCRYPPAHAKSSPMAARKCQPILQQVSRYPFAAHPQGLMRTRRVDTSVSDIQSISALVAGALFASWSKSEQNVSFHLRRFTFI